MRNLPETQRRWARVRIVFLALLLLVGAGAVVRRAYELQIQRAPALREMAEAQYLKEIRLAPKRGTIFDRNGAELASSVDVDSVFANPREMREAGFDPEVAAAQLATVLGVDVRRIATRLASDRYFVWIDRQVTPQRAARVRALGIPGVASTREARRYYPNGSLASHILGFTNIDGVGIEGLELSLEEDLRGSASAVPAIRDRRGAVVFSEHLLDDRAAQGDDVYLTIDKAIQHVAERELALAVQTFEARAVSVVVLDPRTGEILALANYPTFNPNDPGSAPASHRRNRAVTDRFEPGSTVKPFTIAAALAAGTVRSEQRIDCEDGAWELEDHVIHDSHRYESLTPAQILAFSSNIGTAKIGASMGREGLYRALRRFGFGEPTGVPMPGETGGILRHPRRWYEVDAATISFGQGMSVTALQLAMATGALANGGRLMEPILVRKVERGDGEIVREARPEARRQVVPARTARLVADMMTAVTGPGGTGVEAAIEGYLVAGKTGTAQKADYVAGGYADDRWLASFVGFAPAERPRVVISVVIDEPVIAHYGGTVAGPVFRRVGETALRHLGVPAAGGGEALAAHARALRDARRAAREAARNGTAPSSAPVRGPVVTSRAAGEGEAIVPDVEGRTARGAAVALASVGLVPSFEGTGVAARTDPPAGAVAAAGTSVRVVLAPVRPAPEIPAPEAVLAQSDERRPATEATP